MRCAFNVRFGVVRACGAARGGREDAVMWRACFVERQLEARSAPWSKLNEDASLPWLPSRRHVPGAQLNSASVVA